MNEWVIQQTTASPVSCLGMAVASSKGAQRSGSAPTLILLQGTWGCKA